MAYTEKLPSGRWRACYRDSWGKVHRISGTYQRKSDALASAKDQEAKVRLGQWIDPSAGREQFGSVARKWLKTKVAKSPKTYVDYESTLRLHVLPTFERMRLSEINRTFIQAWIEEMRNWYGGRPPFSPRQIEKAVNVLRAVLAEAELSDLIARNPARKLDLPAQATKRRPHSLRPQQVMNLANTIDCRYKALILLTAVTGIRWGEAVGLRWDDLDLVNGIAVIRRSISEVKGQLHDIDTKSHRIRVVPLPPFLCKELNHHGALQKLDSFSWEGRVFTSPKGGPLRRNFYKRVFKPALRPAGLTVSTTFHDLRHTAASLAGSKSYAGESAKVVQQLLGHSSQQVTSETYMHLFPEEIDRLKGSLERVFDLPAPHALHDDATEVTPLRKKGL